MSVLWGEIRKLLWWRNLLLVLILGGLYYWALPWGYVIGFPNGHPMAESHQFALAWHDEFGPTLEPDEMTVLQTRAAALVDEADAMIAADPTLTAAGFHTWADLGQREHVTPDADEAIWELLHGEGGIGWKIYAIDSFVEGYGPVVATSDPTPAQLGRVQQINADEEWRALQSPEVLEFFGHYVPRLSGLMFLVSLLVAAPLVTTDRVSRVRQLQAASLTGRGLLRVQLTATVAVTLGITTLLLGLTSLPLAGFGIGTFWNTPIQSFAAPYLYPPATLGQYCWLLAGLMLLIGVLAGLIGFVLSRANRAYPTLAISLMGTLAVGLPALSMLTELPVTYLSLPALALNTPFAQLIALAGLVAAALAISLVQVHRERRIDIDDR